MDPGDDTTTDSTSGDRFDPTDELRGCAERFIDIVATADHDTTIAACSPWNLGDLALHVGEAWHFWAQVVVDRITDRTLLRDIAPFHADRGPGLAAALRVELTALLAALAPSSHVDPEVWTWTGANRSVAWVRRRLLHETGVHLHDAALAVNRTITISPTVAADGIDEFLTWFAATERGDGEKKVGGTVHLHCTDTPPGQGEWFIASMKEPAATFTREHRKGDAAVRGTAQDVFLWLWRRPAQVEVIGDEVVARRFRAFTRLD